MSEEKVLCLAMLKDEDDLKEGAVVIRKQDIQPFIESFFDAGEEKMLPRLAIVNFPKKDLPPEEKVQIGPENRQKEAADCVAGMIKGGKKGEVKYVELKVFGDPNITGTKAQGFVLSYAIENWGFANFTVAQEDGKTKMDTECTSKETFLQVMSKFYDLYADK